MDGLKYAPLLVATLMTFIVTAWFLTNILFRDGEETTKSVEELAKPRLSRESPFSGNTFGAMLLISFIVAAIVYNKLPDWAPKLFYPIPTNTQYAK